MSTEPESKRATPQESDEAQGFQGDLSITSLYTAGVWCWAGMEGAQFMSNVDTERVFKITNAALSVMRCFRWGLPRLPEGLAQRHVLIDQLVEESHVDVVVELASGLSMRGWRVMNQADDQKRPRRYVEIDLPHVIKHKKHVLSSVTAPNGLLWIPHDIKELSQSLIETLIDDSDKLLIIAEGLVMYLSPNELEELFNLLIPHLRARGGRLIFDWVPTIEQPPPGLIGRTLGWLMRLFTGGESFQRDERSREDLRTQLISLGASTVQMIDTDQVAKARDLPYSKAKTQQLIFCADFRA